MKKVFVKVQSISDIITNSSSEVFMVYDESSINNIKELVNAILSLNKDNKYTFDDLFTARLCIDEERLDDELRCDREYNDFYNSPNVSSYEERLKKAQEYDESNNYEGYPIVYGYEIIAKDVENSDIAKKLSEINKIFDTYVAYC